MTSFFKNISLLIFFSAAFLFCEGQITLTGAVENPNDTSVVETPYNNGVILLKEGKFEEAIKEFDKAIAINETDIDAYYNRGVAKFGMKNKNEACLDWSLGAYYNDMNVLYQLDKICDSIIFLEDDTFKTNDFRSKKDPLQVWDTTNIKMPEFPGGETALFKFLQNNINYPRQARDHNIQGTVFISFYINKNGKVCRPYVLRGAPGLNYEAWRVVKSMPDWSPGTLNGKARCVLYTLPIRFTLR